MKEYESAFPHGYYSEMGQTGLTKREVLAALAFHGFCSQQGPSWFEERNKAAWYAEAAVAAADALIEELGKDVKK